MATQDLTSGGSTGFPFDAQNSVTVRKTIDFSETPAAAADVLQLIHVPAGCRVVSVVAHVTKADSGSSTRTFDVGDGSDADGFLDGIDAKTVAATSSGLTLTEATPNTVTGYSNGKFYAAADTIDLTAVQALADGVITLVAHLVNLAP